MKNEQVPPELANDSGQLVGKVVPNLDVDNPEIFRKTILCTCGCADVLLDVREHTDTRAICTNCSAMFLPDMCAVCGRDCRDASAHPLKVRCADCHE